MLRKNLIFIFAGICLLTFLPLSYAAEPTPTPTPENLQQQINLLQQQVASKVAQLNLVEKKGILGTVSESSDTQITLTDLNGNTRFIDVDELTKFSSPTTNNIGISDIKKGMLIGVLGLYNKDSKRILARDISVQTPLPTIIYGVAGIIDKNNYEITVLAKNGRKTIIEIQDITKTFSYSDSLIRSGFSKISQNETLIATGFPDKTDPGKILASNIILLPGISLASSIDLTPLLSPTVQPSTGSGVKLYPITK